MTRALIPKKWPVQARSKQTFDALVDACTWLLPRRGYAGTTTNHIAERAGVNIASLYEYFADKDAIVAQVAERLVERVLAGLTAGLPEVLRAGPRAVRAWIELVHDTVARERALVAVFVHEIPFTSQLPPVRDLTPRLLAFSNGLRAQLVTPELSPVALRLLVNLVSSTILQLVLDPPRDVSRRAVLDELARRTEDWLAPVTRSAGAR